MKKKRLLALALTLALLAALCACGPNLNTSEGTFGDYGNPPGIGSADHNTSSTTGSEDVFHGTGVVSFAAQVDQLFATSCFAVKEDGTLWAWGSNAYCQLGNGYQGNTISFRDFLCQNTPVKILDDVKDCVTGEGFALALKNDNSVWAWGINYCGQVGNGGTGDTTAADGQLCQSTPVKILEDVDSIYADSDYAAAIKTDKSLWMWGKNNYGQCGVGEAGNGTYHYIIDRIDYSESGSMQSVPAKVLDRVTFFLMYDETTAAITEDGKLWIWGSNAQGQMGNEMYSAGNVCTPLNIMDDVKSVAFHGANFSAIQSDGTLWIWGDNLGGQIGNGQSMNHVVTPTRIMTNVKYVDINTYRTVAITNNGELWSWGGNPYGELGIGTNSNDSLTPTKIMDGVSKVYAQNGCTAAIKEDKSLWLWGYDFGGSLGVGPGDILVYDDSITASPTKVMDDVEELSWQADVTAGAKLIALKSDGSLWAWGTSRAKGLGVPRDGTVTKVMDNVDSVVFNAWINTNGAVIKKDGSLWMWGENNYGQVGKDTDGFEVVGPIRVFD